MRTVVEISRGRAVRVFHRDHVEAWDHPVDQPVKRYLRGVGPCPVCRHGLTGLTALMGDVR